MATSPDSRTQFVDPLLVAESVDPLPDLASFYDETRDLTVLEDGTPLVEATVFAGTGTMIKSAGERDDEDHAADATTTIMRPTRTRHSER